MSGAETVMTWRDLEKLVGTQSAPLHSRLVALEEMAKARIASCDAAIATFSGTLDSGGSVIAVYGGWMGDHMEKGRMSAKAEKGAWETVLRMLDGKAP